MEFYPLNKPNRKHEKIDKSILEQQRKRKYSARGDHGTKPNVAHKYAEARNQKHKIDTVEETEFDVFFNKDFVREILSIAPMARMHIVENIANNVKKFLENNNHTNQYIFNNDIDWSIKRCLGLNEYSLTIAYSGEDWFDYWECKRTSIMFTFDNEALIMRIVIETKSESSDKDFVSKQIFFDKTYSLK